MCVFTSYTAESGELEGGRELFTKKKSASSGLRDTRWRIRKHNCPTENRKETAKVTGVLNSKSRNTSRFNQEDKVSD